MSALGEVAALAMAHRLGGLDREQLLAFQYAKLVRPGDRVIDVGAHTGLHASRFLRLVGPRGSVVMAEPLDGVAERFLVPLYGADPRCELFRGAVADRPGRASFCVVTGSEQESGLARKEAFAQPTSHPPVWTEVEVTTLDALGRGRPVAFVKIDVEGAEHRVLIGGGQVLGEQRPVVALEASDAIRAHGATLEQLHGIIARLRYEPATVAGTPLSRDEFLACARSGEMWDFLLLPVERSVELQGLLRQLDSPLLADVCVDLRATAPGPHARGWVGLSAAESWGRWTDGALAPAAAIQLARPVGDEVTLELTVMSPRDRGTPFTVRLGSERRSLLALARLSAVAARFHGVRGAEVVGIEPGALTAGAGGDARQLGIGIQSLRLW